MKDKLNMHTQNQVDINIRRIGELFPNTLTERKNEKGEVERAIDFDVLRQELSQVLVEGPQERYQFTWPDKRKAQLLANAPISDTLRPCREESVDFDSTENLYIEGDNLNVLKLLQETYLGKVKMIYIDPPYNTGNDFVYEDDFSQSVEEYVGKSGNYDEENLRMVRNLETNGRYHTDWLNMMYPRLRLAKDLLTDDGVIFISIDDNEVANLRKICDEVFGEQNFLTQFIWEKTAHFGRQKLNYYSNCEYLVAYAKKMTSSSGIREVLVEEIKTSLEDAPLYNASNPINELVFPPSSVKFNIADGEYTSSTDDKFVLLDDVIVEDGHNKNQFRIRMRSRWSPKKIVEEFNAGCMYWVKTQNFSVRVIYSNDKESKSSPKQLIFTNSNNPLCAYSRFNKKVGTNDEGSSELSSLLNGDMFSYPKPVSYLSYLISLMWLSEKNRFDDEFIVLDFFSGSATTAHAVMQLNAEDGGKRKFIMVQLPEETDEKSEAYKAGYHNICEIGKERIRRAGAKIKEELQQQNQQLKMGEEPRELPDTGFRVLKLASSNMKDVYYAPQDYTQARIDDLIDNIKEGRTPQDLLFQVMLELGVLLSSPISESEVNGQKVFSVADGFLMACFDSNIKEDTITHIAKQRPHYAVFRDSGYATDSVAVNFEQIFKAYSPDTVRRVL